MFFFPTSMHDSNEEESFIDTGQENGKITIYGISLFILPNTNVKVSLH